MLLSKTWRTVRRQMASRTRWVCILFQTCSLGLTTLKLQHRASQPRFAAVSPIDWRFRPSGFQRHALVDASESPPEKLVISNLRVLNSAPPRPFLGSPYIENPSKRNFEPRLGLAWDPFRDGKTAIRAGFGLYDHLTLLASSTNGVDAAFPFASSRSSGVLPVGSFPTGAFSDISDSATTRIYYILQFNPKRNYILQWNLNVQRQLTPNTTATVGYVGSRGIHMWNLYADPNMVLTTSLVSPDLNFNYANLIYTGPPQGLVWPTPGTGTIIDPFHERSDLGLWNGDYYYDAFETQINKTLSRGFQVEGSYTWAKGIDTGSGGTNPDQYRNSISTPLWFCTKCKRSLSDTDVRHNLS